MKTKVLAVDDSKTIIEMIKRHFNDNDKIEISYTAEDGSEALDIIRNSTDDIDVILLDLIMPKKDGIGVLQKMKELGIKKDVIVFSSFNEENTIRKVSELGVRYFILKPLELDDLENKILEIKEQYNGGIVNKVSNELQLSISKILHNLGIPSNLKGYQYIREGVSLVYATPNLIGGITKELYPKIGNNFDTTPSRVERAIRHAIEVSWNRGDWDFMEEIFGHSVDIDRAKPTNSEFIVTVADKLRLDKLKVK